MAGYVAHEHPIYLTFTADDAFSESKLAKRYIYEHERQVQFCPMEHAHDNDIATENKHDCARCDVTTRAKAHNAKQQPCEQRHLHVQRASRHIQGKCNKFQTRSSYRYMVPRSDHESDMNYVDDLICTHLCCTRRRSVSRHRLSYLPGINPRHNVY